MAFDKQYPNRKDNRKQYPRKAQQCDRSCRPGGDCSWCQSNRSHTDNLRKLSVEEQIKDFDS